MTDPRHVLHELDPALISAYYDEVVDSAERTVVEEHLARCAACRERLAAYATLGGGIRAGIDPPAPASLDARAAKLLKRRPVSRRAAGRPVQPASSRLDLGAWPIWSTLAAAIVVVLLVGAATFVLPIFGGGIGPSVAAAYPCDNTAQCAIAVRFTGPVDRQAVEQSIQINPPVPATFVWPDNTTVYIKPSAPLKPSASYTVSLQPRAGSRGVVGAFASKPTPVAVQFVTTGVDAPVAMAAPGGKTNTAAAPSATVVTLAQANPPPPSAAPSTGVSSSPSAAPPAQALARAASVACKIEPVRGFGALYQSQPKLAARLGCARAPEASVDMFAEPFEHGKLLWHGDTREIIALLSDQRWSVYPDTYTGTETVTPGPGEPVRGFGKVWRETPKLRSAIGNATAPEQALGGAIQEFEHGLLVWTSDRTIYALYSDNTWEQYPDTFVDATATAAAASTTATPTATATPSTSATATPTPTPSSAPSSTPAATTPPSTSTGSGPLVCVVKPVRGFGIVYTSHPDVASRLGCASAPEVGAGSSRQAFEHGLMIRRDDVRQIFVIKGDSTWAVYPDPYQAGEKLPDVGPVPAGRYAPEQGFGKLWREQPGLRQVLGWATAPAQGLDGAYEDFAAGRMLWTADRTIYALYANGTWLSFPDTFVDATATAAAASTTPPPTPTP